MKEEYIDAFRGIIVDTQTTSGYELPVDLEAYIVLLLASHVEKTEFLPKDSFAETYLSLKNKHTAKELGDTCLFVSGVFPEYGSKHGLSRRYYIDIGTSSYSIVAGKISGELFSQLSTHFNFLSDFINVACNSKKIKSIF